MAISGGSLVAAVLALGLAVSTPPLDLNATVRDTLAHNPELRSLRRAHDLAEADVRIAKVYPHNPFLESKVRHVDPSPVDVGTLDITQEHRLAIDVEMRGQSRHRRTIAEAALTRTDYEIAAQEQSFAVRAARAWNGVLYRRLKVSNLEDTLKLVEQAEQEVGNATALGLLRGADPLLTRAETNDVRAAVETSQVALTSAFTELRRTLGDPDTLLSVRGTFDLPPPAPDASALVRHAYDLRPDLLAKRTAVRESAARRDLEEADRYGNPNVGFAYEKDPTATELIGAQVVLNIPVVDDHRQLIRRRELEVQRARVDVDAQELGVRQDVRAAISRLDSARRAAQLYGGKVLPELKGIREGVERLFSMGDPAADLLRVIDVRRRQIRAVEGYLDALWEAREALIDLAAASGDLTLLAGLSGGGAPVTANERP